MRFGDNSDDILYSCAAFHLYGRRVKFCVTGLATAGWTFSAFDRLTALYGRRHPSEIGQSLLRRIFNYRRFTRRFFQRVSAAELERIKQ